MFWDTEPTKPEFNYDVEKKKFIDNLNYLSSMSVEEQTLYKKWQEWNGDLKNTMPKKQISLFTMNHCGFLRIFTIKN